MRDRRALGVDFGGSKVLACAIGAGGTVLASATRPTGRATGPAQALRLLCELAAELTARAGPFTALGVGFPGLVDAAGGVVRSSVMLDGWDRVPFARQAAEALALPCVIDNDVNAAALAELAARGGGPPGAMVFVAVGTGIGGAIAIDGRLFRGASGTAGEIGNTTLHRAGALCWCGRRGCLNTVASGAAIEQAVGGPLVERASREDPAFRAAVAAAAQALGSALADLMNFLNPALVVLGGGVSRLPGFLAEACRTARAEAFPEASERCLFEPARAGYEAGAVGAGLLALATRGAPPADLA